MKKFILFTFLVIFTLSTSTAFARKANPKTAPDNLAVPNKTENKLSEEELSRLNKRAEEIRDMDKTNLTGMEKRELKKEVKGIKENVRRDGGVYYISGATLVHIIILLVILL